MDIAARNSYWAAPIIYTNLEIKIETAIKTPRANTLNDAILRVIAAEWPGDVPKMRPKDRNAIINSKIAEEGYAAPISEDGDRARDLAIRRALRNK